MAKDASLLFTPPPFFPHTCGDSTITNFTCVYPSTDAPIVDHSQNTPDVSLSSKNGEDKSFFEHPLDFSSGFSRNAEGEHSYFSFTSAFYSSHHEDVNKHHEFSDHGCRDLCAYSFDHNVDSLIFNPSKSLVFDDLPIDEVDTPRLSRHFIPS